jgi:Flp pilus assembly protein TadD
MRGALVAGVPALVLAGCAGAPAREEVRGNEPVEIRVEKNPWADAGARRDFDAAMALLKAGNHEQGIELLARVTRGAPDNHIAWINLAIAQMDAGRLEAGEESLKKALAIDPHHPVANNEYAILHRRSGRFTEARRRYEDALKKHPDFLPARKNLGILCELYLKDHECALKHYRIYGEAAPDDKAVTIWIASLESRSPDRPAVPPRSP